MTIADTKEALAAALNGLAGVKAYPSKPATLEAGDAFVRWGGWARADGDASAAFEATYTVVVVLPQGSEEAADSWAYDHADVLTDALQPLMYVDSVQPSLLAVEGSKPGGMYSLTITGRTE